MDLKSKKMPTFPVVQFWTEHPPQHYPYQILVAYEAAFYD
ncbi:hypothetical protein OROGR_020862 [Orobanche gracilis]